MDQDQRRKQEDQPGILPVVSQGQAIAIVEKWD
jgi:hypothetical protein